MKRTVLLLLSLGLLLTGCAARSSFAGITVEEHPLTHNSEGGVSKAFQFLVKTPSIQAERGQWRDLPMTDGVALHLTPVEQQMLLHYPVKVGDSVVYARANSAYEVEVVREDQVVFTYRYPEVAHMASFNEMVQGLSAWNGNWVLETIEEKLFVGGESLNDRLGYTRIFGFRMIASKPFFFFVTQDGKIHVSYDGRVMPQSYDAVPHNGCCDADLFNPRGSERMVSFFALRGDQWYFVDLGDYQ